MNRSDFASDAEYRQALAQAFGPQGNLFAFERASRMYDALDKVIGAASELVDVFDNDHGAIEAYPKGLPSYDEHLHDLLAWREAIDAYRWRARAPIPRMTWRNEHGDDVVCTCGNEVTSDGFDPCDARGLPVQPTAKEWPLTLVRCNRCSAVYHQPPTVPARDAGAVITGEYPR